MSQPTDRTTQIWSGTRPRVCLPEALVLEDLECSAVPGNRRPNLVELVAIVLDSAHHVKSPSLQAAPPPVLGDLQRCL